MVDIMTKLEAMSFMYFLRCKFKTPSFIFDHFHIQTNGIPKNRLSALAVPEMYKRIRKVELILHCDFFNNNTVSLNGKLFEIDKLTTKDIYRWLMEKKFRGPANMIYWSTHLGIDHTSIYKYLKNNYSKFADAYSRNLHYSIVNRFLYTNSKQNYLTNSDPNCKFCASSNIFEREDISHCVIFCPRLTNFWTNFSNLVNRLSHKNFGNEEKIFGLVSFDDPNLLNVLNILLFLAQKVIWKTRLKFEFKSKVVDPWQTLLDDLQTFVTKLYHIMPFNRFIDIFLNTRLVRMSNVKPILNIDII